MSINTGKASEKSKVILLVDVIVLDFLLFYLAFTYIKKCDFCRIQIWLRTWSFIRMFPLCSRL